MSTDIPSRLQASLGERYRVDRELGRGGMATVYLAHDLRHDRPVALKVFHPQLGPALGERFLQEALRLVENAFTGTPAELYYVAPAHLLQAEIQQRLGNREAAADQYSRFIALWRSCDPALRPVVEGARTQLARMVAEP